LEVDTLLVLCWWLVFGGIMSCDFEFSISFTCPFLKEKKRNRKRQKKKKEKKKKKKDIKKL